MCVDLSADQSGQARKERASTVTLIIQQTCQLNIEDAEILEVLTQDGTAEDKFDISKVELPARKPTLNISANGKWKLTVRSGNFSGPYQKEIKDLMFKDAAAAHVKNGFDDFKALSGADQEIASNTSGVKNEIHPCQYMICLDYEKDIPGTYTCSVTFTLATEGA